MSNLTKGKKIFVGILVLIMAFMVLAAFLLIPRIGKKPDDYVWKGAESFDIQKIKAVEKEVGKEFKILQLTDTQLDFPFKSRKTLKNIIDTLIKENNPDLIVITGDLVAGVFTHFYVNDIIEIFDSYKIPWAPVFGNHDRELNANLYYQSKQYYKSKYCLFSEGPNNIQGVGNYVVNIKENDKIIYSLFMMDSNDQREYIVDGKTVKGYDYINPNQIGWYADNIEEIEKCAGEKVPSMAFFHIPLPEYLIAYKLAKKGSEEAVIIDGDKREGVGAPNENSGFFDKMVELGSTTNIFVGHDHINDFSVKYKGITMTYGVKTGNFSTYHEDKLGGTLIKIGDGVQIERKYIKK